MAYKHKLKWCKKQKKGISFIKPNDNLSKEYIDSAEETLAVLRLINNKSNMWSATIKYYFEYFLVYSLLMKFGIQCEIHDCTIFLCSFLEQKKIIRNNFTYILEQDKQLRIDNQYYLRNTPIRINHEDLFDMLLEFKDSLRNITFDDVHLVRTELKGLTV